MNLHTSQLVTMVKGLGIRKIIGASKVHLFLQFLIDSFLAFGIGILLSVSLIVLTKSIGRFFSSSFSNEGARSRVVNEAFVRKMGWENAEAAHGKEISGPGADGQIIGVVKDFYFHSPHKLIQPLILEYAAHGTFALVRPNSGDNIDQVIEEIGSMWSNHLSETPFTYSFLESDYEKQFMQEKSAFSVVGSISMLVVAL